MNESEFDKLIEQAKGEQLRTIPGSKTDVGLKMRQKEIEAARNREEAERKDRVARVLQLRQERQRMGFHDGTSPELVLGEKNAETCKLFIDRMRKINFKGSVLAQDEPEKQKSKIWFLREKPQNKNETWKIRGYGIGTLGGKDTGLPWNVYLCEDGLLRVFKIEGTIYNYSKHAQENRIGATDLPIHNDTGVIIGPSIGYKYSRLVGYSDNGFENKYGSPIPEYESVFVAVSLEKQLAEHANAANKDMMWKPTDIQAI